MEAPGIYFSPSPDFLPHAQDMKIVWSCYLNTARSHTWRETPSLLCTVRCKHHLKQPTLGCWPGLRVGSPSGFLLLMIPLPHSRINNQDSTTEMLLGALGAKIVNSRDAKGR